MYCQRPSGCKTSQTHPTSRETRNTGGENGRQNTPSRAPSSGRQLREEYVHLWSVVEVFCKQWSRLGCQREWSLMLARCTVTSFCGLHHFLERLCIEVCGSSAAVLGCLVPLCNFRTCLNTRLAPLEMTWFSSYITVFHGRLRGYFDLLLRLVGLHSHAPIVADGKHIVKSIECLWRCHDQRNCLRGLFCVVFFFLAT